MFYLRPSQGDFPPEETFFPFRRPPPILEEVAPTEEDLLNDPSMVWTLDESLTQRERWLSLRDPPDFVATSIATEGLWLFFKRDNKGIPLEPPPFRQSFSNDSICYKRGKNSNPQTFCGGLVRKEHSDQVQASPPPVLESSFLRQKEKWEISADPGSFKVEHLCSDPFICYGDLRPNLKIRNPGHVGGESGCDRCLLVSPHPPRFSEVFLFPHGWRNLHVSSSPVWLDNGSMGLYSSHATHQGLSPSSRSVCNLLFRRFSGSGRDESSLCSSLSLDGEAVDLVRFRHQLPKIFPSSFPVNRISRNSIELENPHLSSPLRQGFQNPCPLSGVVKSHGDDPERVRGPGGVTQLCPSYSVSGQDVASATHSVDERAFLPSLQGHSFPTDVVLSEALRPFLDAKFLATPISFRPPVPFLDLATDASDYGWSGVIGPITVHDSWTQWEQSNSINWREIRAILNSVSYLQDCLAHRTIRIHTDSMVALFCLKRMGSLHSAEISATIRHLLLLCQERNIIFVPVHISGCLNVLADQASRSGPIQTEWCLDPDTFDWIFQECPCSPQVDLFATRANFRFARYVSPCPDPGAFAQDALKEEFDWNQFQCIYAFPPPSMMPHIIDKICSFKGTMVLIAPALSEPWLPRLQSRAHRVCILPESSFLFQIVDQEVIYKDHYFWKLSLWQLFPTQLRVWSGNL